LSAELTKKRTPSDCFFVAILPTGNKIYCILSWDLETTPQQLSQ